MINVTDDPPFDDGSPLRAAYEQGVKETLDACAQYVNDIEGTYASPESLAQHLAREFRDVATDIYGDRWRVK